MRRFLIFVGILHDPDGPPKGSVRYWLFIAGPVFVVAIGLTFLLR